MLPTVRNGSTRSNSRAAPLYPISLMRESKQYVRLIILGERILNNNAWLQYKSIVWKIDVHIAVPYDTLCTWWKHLFGQCVVTIYLLNVTEEFGEDSMRSAFRRSRPVWQTWQWLCVSVSRDCVYVYHDVRFASVKLVVITILINVWLTRIHVHE